MAAFSLSVEVELVSTDKGLNLFPTYSDTDIVDALKRVAAKGSVNAHLDIKSNS